MLVFSKMMLTITQVLWYLVTLTMLGECKFHGEISALLYPFLLHAVITKYHTAASCSDIRVTGTLQLHFQFQCVADQIYSFATLL